MKSINYFPLVLFIPIAIIQMTIVPLIAFKFITPNLILILLVFYTLQYGQIYGTVLGFILGVLFDLISGGIIGSSMFSFTLAGFIAGYFYNENKIEVNRSSLNFIFILLITASASTFVHSIITESSIQTNVLYLLFEEGILPGFYTAIFGFLVIIFKKNKRIE